MRAIRSGGGGRKMRGVVVGIVSNINDPDQQGRVKVRLPWLDDQGGQPIETHWARVAGWYAGNSRGTMFIPELGDEVIVGFTHGDPNHPYVIGAVWNGEHKVPGPGNSDGKNDHKWFRSRAGHDFEFLDSDGGEQIRLVDSSTNNSIVIDTPGDTITTEAKTGTINIKAPAGHIQIDCVDLKMTTSEGRNLEVGTSHTVKVGQNRTVNVSAGNLVQLAGSSMTMTTASFSSSTSAAVGVQAGAAVVNQGSLGTEVKGWSEVQQGPVTRTVGSQKLTADAFLTVNSEGTPSGPLTVLAGNLTTQADGGVVASGSVATVMAGLVNAKGSGMVVAKDGQGGKAALSTWLGGLLLLNPNTLTFPATKLLDPIMGLDFHTTLPSLTVPPLPPLPFFPSPFMGPILIDFKPTVLINFRPAAGAGATAVSFHRPPLPWPWPPISPRPMITAAVMALMTAPFNALLEMGKAKVQALAATSNNDTFKRGFVADLLGSSHVDASGGTVESAGRTYSISASDGGSFNFKRVFPMFSSAQSFLAFLASLIPLPVANASVSLASPSTTVSDAPLGMMIPLGANSCSDVPLVPNGMVVGFSNVLTGMSIGDLLNQLIWSLVQGATTRGFQAGLRRAGTAAQRRIQRSNDPDLANTANQRSTERCTAEGDPVDVVTGAVIGRDLDCDFPAPLPFRFERFYSSARTDRRDGVRPLQPLGPGWRHTCDEWLRNTVTTDEIDQPFLVWMKGDGGLVELPRLAVGAEPHFDPRERVFFSHPTETEWHLVDRDETTRVFVLHDSKRYRLARMQDAFGNVIELSHDDGGRLLRVTDAAGRIYACHHQGDRLAEIRVVEARGEPCNQLVARFEYDGRGRLVAAYDAAGAPERYAYDETDRLAAKTDRGGYTARWRYDELGRCTWTAGDDNRFWRTFTHETGAAVTRVRDGIGRETLYRYDEESGNVTEALYPDGQIAAYVYDDNGWLTEHKAVDGRTRKYAYDAFGRRVADVRPDDTTLEMRYDAHGRLVETTDALGRVSTLVRDERGALIEVHRPGLPTIRYVRDERGAAVEKWEGGRLVRRARYDEQGLIVRDERPGFATTTWQTDPFGRVVRSKQGGRVVTRKHDACGRIIELRDERGEQVRHRFDAAGRVVERQDPDGRVWRYAYEGPPTKPTRVTLPDGGELRFAHDTEGFVEEVTLPSGHRQRLTRRADGHIVRRELVGAGWHEEYSRDGGGRIEEVRRSDGRWQRFTRDALGHVIKDEASDGLTYQVERDPFGRMVAVDDGFETVKLGYGPGGGLVEDVRGDDSARLKLDRDGRVRRRTTSWGEQTGFGYDDAGRLARVEVRAGEVIEHGYDDLGRRALTRHPNGAVDRRGYDALDRPVEQVVEANGKRLLHRDLQWKGPRLAEIRDSLRGRMAITRDADGRVTAVEHGTGAREAYAFGAHREQSEVPAGSVTRDASGRPVRVGERRVDYGPGGAARRVVDGEGRATVYRYDARNRLIQIERPEGPEIHYHYDALGRRIARVAGDRVDRYHWVGLSLAARSGPDGIEQFIREPDGDLALARRRPDGRLDAIHSDPAGTPHTLTGPDGSVSWWVERGAQGDELATGGDGPRLALGRPGEWVEPDEGLIHSVFRTLDPTHCAWLQPDPMRWTTGVFDHTVSADPWYWYDPLGLALCTRAIGQAGESAVKNHLLSMVDADQQPIYSDTGFRPAYHGLDIVLRHNETGALHVFEVKANSSQLSAAQQQPTTYIDSRAQRMQNTNSSQSGLSGASSGPVQTPDPSTGHTVNQSLGQELQGTPPATG
ncbi:MAG: phage baseplate assembly protein V, partial [bacterium]